MTVTTCCTVLSAETECSPGELVANYTNPGDIAIELGDDDWLATTAAKAGRHALAIVDESQSAAAVEQHFDKMLLPTRRCLARVLTASNSQLPRLLRSQPDRAQIIVASYHWLAGCRNVEGVRNACRVALTPDGALILGHRDDA